MVDAQKITELMDRWFIVLGSWELNDKGEVDVTGSVTLMPYKDGTWGQIPVRFGRVSSVFEARGVGLRSLANSPKWVGLNYIVDSNLLKTLAHAPQFVGQDFDAGDNHLLTSLSCAHTTVGRDLDVQKCNLTSLDNCAQVDGGIWVKGNPHLTNIRGMPDCKHLFIDYHPRLGLLPALKVPEINVIKISHHFPQDPHAGNKLTDILHKYAGTGKSGMLNCALELKHAGFVENARW